LSPQSRGLRPYPAKEFSCQQLGELGTLLTSNFTPNPAVGGSIDWDKVASQANMSLSGPQLDALQTMTTLHQLNARVKQFYSAQGGSP